MLFEVVGGREIYYINAVINLPRHAARVHFPVSLALRHSHVTQFRKWNVNGSDVSLPGLAHKTFPYMFPHVPPTPPYFLANWNVDTLEPTC